MVYSLFREVRDHESRARAVAARARDAERSLGEVRAMRRARDEARQAAAALRGTSKQRRMVMELNRETALMHPSPAPPPPAQVEKERRRAVMMKKRQDMQVGMKWLSKSE